MKVRRSREPLLWLLFSAGGMLAALAFPALALALWVGPVLGWTPDPSPDALRATVGSLVGRLGVFGLVALALYHWAHRFRYTLYDGLQLYHLNQLIAVVTYGLATALTLVAAVVLLV